MPGMDTVGARMKAGQRFIPEVLLSARTMQACLELIKPQLAAGDSAQRGTIVIGTVEGDVHDIGKNLVAMMLEGAGFEVVNVGTGVTPAQFVAAVREHQATLVAMSGLLTTTIPKMGARSPCSRTRACAGRSRSWSAAPRSRTASPTRSAPTPTAPTPPRRSTRPSC